MAVDSTGKLYFAEGSVVAVYGAYNAADASAQDRLRCAVRVSR